jgi:heme-degrading monooxygenase HmoA
MMIQFIREFVVKEGASGQFELAFGPGGAWSTLFSRCPGFRGATLLRDTKNPRRFLAIDIWGSESQREQALVENEAEYADLEAALDEWTESSAGLGSFSMRAEATVRARSRAGRTSRRTSR